MKRTVWLLLLAPLVTSLPAVRAEEKFELKDGDRVVLIGSTLIEREQRYGYWETALTARWPDRNITFRNLGWSGDTVWGESRASFDPPEVGYKRLVEHTLALKPTMIFVGYGTNESFAGESGLPRFVTQLNRLLDDLTPSKSRIVLMAPLMFVEDNWPENDTGPDGTLKRKQQDLKRYAEAIRRVAQERKALFVADLYEKYRGALVLTDNGIHLMDYGYWATASILLEELRVPPPKTMTLELDGGAPKQVLQQVLPEPPAPHTNKHLTFTAENSVIARELKPGTYTLQIDGKPVQSADRDAWMSRSGTFVKKGPSLDQAEKLRQTIVEKNRLYFRRWRPANETYLFGFRKHEQGQNAREIPLFDPLVEQLEKEIAKLRVPVKHTYELVPEK